MELRHWLFAIAGIVIGACIAASCSTENELDVPVQTGDVVTNYKKTVQYEKTQQFSSDLDAFATYAINMQALRMTWWIMLSNGFANDNAFCATSEDINGRDGTNSERKLNTYHSRRAMSRRLVANYIC